MTVFVALIFQVLFVFFAMVINIGLLVHDKINLQNAVDLGAYYGAQRQAEILNEIAHVNYQIRQDNKLLAWRYRVLGTLGRVDPLTYTAGSSPSTQNYAVNQPDPEEVPSVCVFNPFWLEATKNSTEDENYCKRQYGSSGTIKGIPRLTVVAPFLPGVIIGRILIDNLIDTQKGALVNQGPANWVFAAQMMVAYKMAIASRKAVIEQLATNLVKADPVDQYNQSTRQGVLQTITKNLTVSNASTFSEESFTFRNGLATPACAGSNNNGSPTIVDIRTSPLLVYTYSTTAGGDYQINPAILGAPLPFDPSPIPAQQFQFLSAFTNGEPSTQFTNATELGRQGSSLGYEKNPWCMAYVGVSAKTSPRKPFAPFGQPVELVARSFAQPFGGRIGPWYKNQWPQASEISTGERVDPLTPPRMYNDASDHNGDYKTLLPNYSRFPGDRLGVKSLAHQAGARQLIRGYRGKPNGMTFDFFTNFDRIPITGDPLAFDNAIGAPPDKISPRVRNVRTAETVAIAPDLFDATYYSIDLNFASNYKSLNPARLPNLGNPFGLQRAVAPDLGGRNGTDFAGFNVDSQIQVANNPANLDPLLRNTLGYYLSKAEHVLTGWAPLSNSNFGFPAPRFAKCDAFAKKAEFMVPGVCTNGGRVGYSVRIISRDHLLSNKWQVGGEGQTGAIKNPPPPDL